MNYKKICDYLINESSFDEKLANAIISQKKVLRYLHQETGFLFCA